MSGSDFLSLRKARATMKYATQQPMLATSTSQVRACLPRNGARRVRNPMSIRV